MNEQQIEQLLRDETRRRRFEDEEHLRQLSSTLTSDLSSWVLRRRIAGTALSVALLIAIPMAYSRLLPATGDEPMVACNLHGQEEAVIQCANNLLS